MNDRLIEFEFITKNIKLTVDDLPILSLIIYQQQLLYDKHFTDTRNCCRLFEDCGHELR